MNKKELGERLKKMRLEKGLTLYRIAKNGNIRPHQAKAIEVGEANYTIDSLLGYLFGCDFTFDDLIRHFNK